jgi:phosphonate transport system substrate-binding protein
MLPIGNAVDRRTALKAIVVLAATCGGEAAVAASATPIAVGTTPVFLDDHLGLLQRWRSELEGVLHQPVGFVQRGTYQEITDLLLSGRVDAAWVCGYPYVVNVPRFRLMAIPLWLGQPLYRSYLIVPPTDLATAHITDLHDKVFAFSDPNSNSGYLVPRVELIRAGRSPDTFFRRAFFTFGHRKVVEAVAAGLAQGGEVDGYVWETLALQRPDITNRTRVAWRSRLHGFPPVVGRGDLAENAFRRLQSAFLDMGNSASGRAILKELNLDGFTAGDDHVFDSIRELVRISATSKG